MTDNTAKIAILRKALEAQPQAHLAARCGPLLGDMLSADDLEKLSNHLGQLAREKARNTLTSG